MIEIKAWQYIYTHLEYDEIEDLIREHYGEKVNIAHHKAGWETYLYSQEGLSQNILDELDKRVKYKASPQPDSQKPHKYQFYGLPDGRFAVSRIVPLPEKIVSRVDNNYFCHTLILEKASLVQLNCNPFYLFELDPSPFYEDILGAIQDEGDLRTGNIPERSIKLSTPLPKVELNENITQAQQLHLGWLAMNAGQIKEKRLYLAVVGKYEDIFEIIRLAFELIPPQKRLNCWFDTGFEECHPAMTRVWLAGFAQKPPSNFTYLSFAADLNAVPSIDGLPNRPSTYFERWWENCIRNGKSEMVQEQEATAMVLQNIISGEFRQAEKQALKDLSSKELECYPRPDPRLLQKKEDELVKQGFPPKLVKKIRTNKDLKAQWFLLTNEIEWQKVSDWFYEDYKTNLSSKPSDPELKKIKEAMQKANHQQLQTLYYFWHRHQRNSVFGERKLSNDWERQLRQMSEEEYREWFLQFLGNPKLNLEDLFVKEKTFLFFDCLLKTPSPHPKLYTKLFSEKYYVFSLLESWMYQLIIWGENEALDLLADYVVILPRFDKWRLKKALRKARWGKRISASRFQAALAGEKIEKMSMGSSNAKEASKTEKDSQEEQENEQKDY